MCHSAECHGAELGAVFKVDAEIKINDLWNDSIIYFTFVNSITAIQLYDKTVLEVFFIKLL